MREKVIGSEFIMRKSIRVRVHYKEEQRDETSIIEKERWCKS